MFLLRLLDAVPAIIPWVTWGIGIALSIKFFTRASGSSCSPPAQCFCTVFHEFTAAGRINRSGTVRQRMVFGGTYPIGWEFRFAPGCTPAVLNVPNRHPEHRS